MQSRCGHTIGPLCAIDKAHATHYSDASYIEQVADKTRRAERDVGGMEMRRLACLHAPGQKTSSPRPPLLHPPQLSAAFGFCVGMGRAARRAVCLSPGLQASSELSFVRDVVSDGPPHLPPAPRCPPMLQHSTVGSSVCLARRHLDAFSHARLLGQPAVAARTIQASGSRVACGVRGLAALAPTQPSSTACSSQPATDGAELATSNAALGRCSVSTSHRTTRPVLNSFWPIILHCCHDCPLVLAFCSPPTCSSTIHTPSPSCSQDVAAIITASDRRARPRHTTTPLRPKLPAIEASAVVPT